MIPSATEFILTSLPDEPCKVNVPLPSIVLVVAPEGLVLIVHPLLLSLQLALFVKPYAQLWIATNAINECLRVFVNLCV